MISINVVRTAAVQRTKLTLRRRTIQQSLYELRRESLGQFGGGLLESGLAGRLLGDIDGHAGLAVHGKDFAGALLDFQFDARLAGDQVALPQAKGAEGIAGDLNIRSLRGF